MKKRGLGRLKQSPKSNGCFAGIMLLEFSGFAGKLNSKLASASNLLEIRLSRGLYARKARIISKCMNIILMALL